MANTTAAETVSRHPEIKSVILEWLMPFRAIYTDHYDNVIAAKGATYCYL